MKKKKVLKLKSKWIKLIKEIILVIFMGIISSAYIIKIASDITEVIGLFSVFVTITILATGIIEDEKK